MNAVSALILAGLIVTALQLFWLELIWNQPRK